MQLHCIKNYCTLPHTKNQKIPQCMWQKVEIVNLSFSLSLSSYSTIRLFSLVTFPLSVGGIFFRFAILFFVLPPIIYYLIISFMLSS